MKNFHRRIGFVPFIILAATGFYYGVADNFEAGINAFAACLIIAVYEGQLRRLERGQERGTAI